jgi:LysM repeat protein
MRKRFVILVFLMLLCLLAGEPGPARAQTPSDPTPTLTASPTTTQGSTPDPADVVQIATPGADGKIIHIVVAGETLISIAQAYGVAFNDLLELNGFTADAVIYPGDELIIQAGYTATPTSAPTMTATQTKVPTSTRRPTRTPFSQRQADSGGDPTVQAQPILTPTVDAAQGGSDSIGTVLLVGIAVLGGGGILMIIVGGLLRRSA